jgi:hypothetical protein
MLDFKNLLDCTQLCRMKNENNGKPKKKNEKSDHNDCEQANHHIKRAATYQTALEKSAH